MRQMWIGVGIAIVLCTAVGVGLDLIVQQLPQKQQEGLETVIGVVAVVAVSYMIVWIRRHARGIKATLEGEAASALAAFQDATDTTAAAGAGSLLGLLAAVAIGVGLCCGGVRIKPHPLLPRHRPGPRLRRRRPARLRRPHRPRGGLARC
jgi:high-affinity iron transporter